MPVLAVQMGKGEWGRENREGKARSGQEADKRRTRTSRRVSRGTSRGDMESKQSERHIKKKKMMMMEAIGQGLYMEKLRLD